MTRAAIVVLALCAPVAHADPLALRADAFATTASPTGLIDLTAGGAATDWLRADAIVWMGAGAGLADQTGADVLILSAHARAPRGRGDATLGRFVLTVGALRPLHMDGADARVHLAHRLDVEAFAGVPVEPDFGWHAWDWLAGGRVSRRLGDWGSAGVAYLEEREHGELSTRELGLDAGGAVDRKTDAAAKLAVDLISHGVALAEVSLTRRLRKVRVEAYANETAASHLLPATSLFSVLGDIPAEHAGARVTWRAAPRLDIDADGGVLRAGDGPPGATSTGAALTARATLRLDDAGRGALALELSREGAGADGAWSGVRGVARVPLDLAFTASTELELVRPDDDAHGAWWPWALGAIGWRRGDWDAAVAVEASASAEYRYRVDALARLSRRWGAP